MRHASDAICLALSRLFSPDVPELDSYFHELIFISKLEVIVCVVRCDVVYYLNSHIPGNEPLKNRIS